jgi:tRNA modification GTPase
LVNHKKENKNSNNNDDGDTIFALSSGFTGAQPTAVAVVRISGPKAHSVLQQLSLPTSQLPPPRKAVLRKLYHSPNDDNSNNNNNNMINNSKKRMMIDHALVLLFQQPNSFTGEDLVELQCHGSRAVVAQLLEVLPTLGCRMAEPGEFTQRAFGQGKLDLVQVEALADLLGADTSSQLQQALSQLDGTLSSLYDRWRSQLISGLAHAEAVIDFGDDERLGNDEEEEEHPEDVYAAQWNVWGTVQGRMMELRTSMKHHLQDARRGELVREGVRIAIVGPPNAGKSSLFNLLARRDAAIVSPIAGTTRDVLEVSLDLGGIKCVLSDTAGVRSETVVVDSLELEGMKRTRVAAGKADLVVAMVDATDIDVGMEIVKDVLWQEQQAQEQPVLDDEFQQQLPSAFSSSSSSDHVLLVLNKLDLINGTVRYPHSQEDEGSTTTTTPTKEPPLSFGGGTFEISCATQAGIDDFLNGLTKIVQARIQQGESFSTRSNTNNHNNDGTTSTTRTSSGGGPDPEGAMITRARHRQHVQAASEALERFDTLSRQGSMAVDMAAEELRLAASELGRITGAVDVEDVLDVLFTDFCIGK